MLIDETNVNTHSYQYALLQYKNIYSLEVFNIGIVFKESTGKTMSHIPSDISYINNCLDIQEISGFNFTLDLVKQRIDNEGGLKTGVISNSLSLSEYREMTTELSSEEAFQNIIEEYISIRKLRDLDHHSRRKDYEKLSIINLLKTTAANKNISNVEFRKTYTIAHKMLDAVYLDKDKQPKVVAEVASLFVKDFEGSFINSSFVLQEARRAKSVKDEFLYVPMLKKIMNKTEQNHLGWAKDMAQHLKIDIFTDPSQEAFLERLVH